MKKKGPINFAQWLAICMEKSIWIYGKEKKEVASYFLAQKMHVKQLFF